MNINRLVRGLLLSVGACAAPVTMPPGPASGTEPAGGSASYSCQADNDATATKTPVTFALISPPTSVRPGDVLSLSGNLGITLSDTAARQSRLQLAKNANIDATDFNLVVKAGGKTVRVAPSSVISTPAPIKTPFELSADVSYPDVKIPASATGAVTITMPLARTASTEVVGAPETVTFTAHLRQDSPLFNGRDFACWADKRGTSASIARIPLEPRQDDDAAPPPVPPAPAAPPPSAPASPAIDAPAAAATSPAPSPLPPSAPASTSPASQESAPVSTALADAVIPPATESGKTFVPGWILALFIAILPTAAVAGAVVQRKRLQRLRAMTTTSG